MTATDYSRPARFVRQLDERLAREPVKTQRALLGLQLKTWTRAYDGFVKKLDRNERGVTDKGGPDVDDFLIVIAEIQTRLARLR